MSRCFLLLCSAVVIRVLAFGNKKDFLRLDQMLISQTILQPFKRVIQNPNGIIFVTGPTGSGKTTTLYAALSEINDSSINIVTIEDPIELQVEGLNQSQVNSHIDLSFGMLDAAPRPFPRVQADGSALPSWLSFDPAARKFSFAAGEPAAAHPATGRISLPWSGTGGRPGADPAKGAPGGARAGAPSAPARAWFATLRADRQRDRRVRSQRAAFGLPYGSRIGQADAFADAGHRGEANPLLALVRLVLDFDLDQVTASLIRNAVLT